MLARRVILLALFLGLAPLARAAEPLHLTVAWTAVPGQLAPVLYQNKAILKHYGDSYVVDPVYVAGAGQQLTMLATGDLLIAQFAAAPLTLAIQNAHMEDIRVIGDATRDGYKDYHTRKYMVLADGPIRTVADLKGKVIGSNSIGGAMDMAFRNYMLEHNLIDKRDYSVVEIPIATQAAALYAKKIDLAFLTTPFEFEPLRSGKARTLFTMKQAMGGESELAVMATRAPFIAAHRAAFVDYMEDTMRAMRWFLDPANRAEAVKIVAAFNKQPPDAIASWLFTKADDYHAADLRPDLDAMQSNIEVQRRLGLLKMDVSVKKYADMSLIDDAAKRLK